MTALEKAAVAAAEIVRDQKDNALYFDGKAIARAVLMAVREPTEAMMRAVADSTGYVHPEDFTAMIDAILEETR